MKRIVCLGLACLLFLCGCAEQAKTEDDAQSGGKSELLLAATDLAGMQDITVFLHEQNDCEYTVNFYSHEGEVLHKEEFSTFHPGWRGLFVCDQGGRKLLLSYNPYMNQGMACYQFSLYSVDGEIDSGEVQFDIDGRYPLPIDEMEAFFERANGYLKHSKILFSTLDGRVEYKSDREVLVEYDFLYDGVIDTQYEEDDTLREKLEKFGQYKAESYKNS